MTGTCAACLHTNQSWSYLNHLVLGPVLGNREYVLGPVLGSREYVLGPVLGSRE